MTVGGELLEANGVYLVMSGLEHVATSSRGNQFRAISGRRVLHEGTTQPRDVGDERALRGPGRIVAPQLLDKIVRAHDPTRASDERGKDRAFLRSGDPQQLPAIVDHLKRPQDQETHGAEAIALGPKR